jgi:hypothetical protein
MNQTQLARLAAVGNALRPEWPAQSLLSLLKREFSSRAYRDVAVAMAYVAADEETTTPGRLLENGPWWQATKLPTAGHPLPRPFTAPTPLSDSEREAAEIAAAAAFSELQRKRETARAEVNERQRLRDEKEAAK